MSKILIIANSDLGLYKFRKELVECLLENNQVFLSLPDGEFIPEFINLGCVFEDTDFNRRGLNPLADIKLLIRYLRLINRIKPDVVLTYTIKPNVYGGIACRLLHKPCLANITGLGTAIENPGILQRIALCMYKTGLKKNSHIFFQNNSNRELFLYKKMVNKKQCSVIPGSGVNLNVHCYEDYPSADSNIRVIFIGRIMKDKGINELLEAAQTIKNIYPEGFFDIIGACDEDYDAELQALAAKGIINYLGSRSDVHPYIKRSWAVVLPSYHEGTANVLLEAAATGRPVIATRVTGCVETYDEGISGIGCDVRDVNSLVKALQTFIELPYEEKVLMGRKGRQKMEQEYDRQIVIDAYMTEIEKVLDQSSHS